MFGVWTGTHRLEMGFVFCSRNCRYVRMGGENKPIPHRRFPLFYSSTRLTHHPTEEFKLLLFCPWAYPVPYSNKAFLELKTSFYQPDTRISHYFLCTTLPLNNISPWILNSVSQFETQRIMSLLPLHIFKKGKTNQKSRKMTGPLFELNAGTSPFA